MDRPPLLAASHDYQLSVLSMGLPMGRDGNAVNKTKPLSIKFTEHCTKPNSFPSLILPFNLWPALQLPPSVASFPLLSSPYILLFPLHPAPNAPLHQFLLSLHLPHFPSSFTILPSISLLYSSLSCSFALRPTTFLFLLILPSTIYPSLCPSSSYSSLCSSPAAASLPLTHLPPFRFLLVPPWTINPSVYFLPFHSSLLHVNHSPSSLPFTPHVTIPLAPRSDCRLSPFRLPLPCTRAPFPPSLSSGTPLSVARL